MSDLNAVIELLRSANARLLDLEALLDTEYTLLGSRDLDSYEPLLDRKMAALEQAGKLEAELGKALGLPRGANIHKRLAEMLEGSSCAEDWQRFSALVRRCAEKNTVNGAIVSSRRASVKKLLLILQGGEATTPVYGPDAQVNDTGSSVWRARV